MENGGRKTAEILHLLTSYAESRGGLRTFVPEYPSFDPTSHGKANLEYTFWRGWAKTPIMRPRTGEAATGRHLACGFPRQSGESARQTTQVGHRQFTQVLGELRIAVRVVFRTFAKEKTRFAVQGPDNRRQKAQQMAAHDSFASSGPCWRLRLMERANLCSIDIARN